MGYSGESCICTMICKIYIVTNVDCLYMATSLWYRLTAPKIEVDECSFPCHFFLQPKEIVVRSKRWRRSALADEKQNSSWFQVAYSSNLCVLFYRMKVKLCQKASPPKKNWIYKESIIGLELGYSCIVNLICRNGWWQQHNGFGGCYGLSLGFFWSFMGTRGCRDSQIGWMHGMQ